MAGQTNLVVGNASAVDDGTLLFLEAQRDKQRSPQLTTTLLGRIPTAARKRVVSPFPASSLASDGEFRDARSRSPISQLCSKQRPAEEQTIPTERSAVEARLKSLRNQLRGANVRGGGSQLDADDQNLSSPAPTLKSLIPSTPPTPTLKASIPSTPQDKRALVMESKRRMLEELTDKMKLCLTRAQESHANKDEQKVEKYQELANSIKEQMDKISSVRAPEISRAAKPPRALP